SNLLSNAIRYTPAQQTVTVTFWATSHHAHVRIQNPGAGISAKHLAHVFERFYRPDASRQRSGEGAGLGLAIVKSIIEAHGGKITASSTADSTTFEISTPK